MGPYRFATCTLDGPRRALTRDGQDVAISRRGFEALQLLLKSYPNAVSRDELYAALWPDTFVNLTNLNNVINEIRTAVGDEMKKFVTTKYGYGYVVGVPVAHETPARGAGSRFALIIAGKTMPLADGENVVGRSPDVAVFLDLPSISRQHAVIRVTTTHAEVEDLGSKNGTFISDDRVSQPCRLRDRDTLRFGTICGVFRRVPAGSTLTETPAR